MLGTLSKHEKASLIFIFMLDLATMTISCIRFGLTVQAMLSRTTCKLEVYIYFWIQLNNIVSVAILNVEHATQILVVGLPPLRPLLSVIRSKANSSHGKSFRSSKTPDIRKSKGNR
jgi:hypothetical protein